MGQKQNRFNWPTLRIIRRHRRSLLLSTTRLNTSAEISKTGTRLASPRPASRFTRPSTSPRKRNHLKVELVQVPAVQGSMMTLNAKTGEIVAMIGGYDFLTNKFNNAFQAYRQTGSAFKPFVYTAAIEWGMTPDTTVSGAAININGWQPHNYDGSTSCGDMPLKTALAHSMNIPAVHLLQTVGIQTGAQMVRRFGIKVPMAPYLPSALGATEVPLDQMVSAYSTFPNKGVRVEPHMVRRVLDRDGAVLEEWAKTTYKVVSEYV